MCRRSKTGAQEERTDQSSPVPDRAGGSSDAERGFNGGVIKHQSVPAALTQAAFLCIESAT